MLVELGFLPDFECLSATRQQGIAPLSEGAAVTPSLRLVDSRPPPGSSSNTTPALRLADQRPLPPRAETEAFASDPSHSLYGKSLSNQIVPRERFNMGFRSFRELLSDQQAAHRSPVSQTRSDTLIGLKRKVRVKDWIYTTRLQKGGALLEDMRQLVRAWGDALPEIQRDRILRSNLLNKRTRARLADVYRCVFLPRFVHGPVPEAWKLVRPLEDCQAPIQIVRPVYYWITAKSEPLIADFCRQFILPRLAIVRTGIGTNEVLNWLSAKRCPWSRAVATRVARGLLAALRDFGILEGRVQKRLANVLLPTPGFAYLARCLRETGAVSYSLLNHPDWQLFLLEADEVERLFLLAHQERLLEYHAAGSTVSISFPTESIEEYAHVVAQKSV